MADYNASLGNYAEAIQLVTQALVIYEHTEGKEHPDYATMLSNLVGYNASLGNYEEEMRLITEVLRIRGNTLGKEHPDYAEALNNLADYNASLGNYEEAIRLEREALDILEKTLGKEHPKYAALLSNLASYHSYLSDYQEAIRLGKEALDIRRKTLGDEHPDYAMSLNNLAGYNFDNRLYQAAAEYAIEATQTFGKIICNTFTDLTTNERTLFWNKYNKWFENDLPKLTFYIGNDSLTASAYNGALLGKGLLLNSEIEMNKLLLESGDTAVVTKYQALKTNKAMLSKMQESGWAELLLITDSLEQDRRRAALTASIDSLERILQAQERALVQQSKVYGNYTKNLSIDWREVQQKLGRADVAVEFTSFGTKGDNIKYIALTLTKEDDVPHITPLFEKEALDTIPKTGYYSTSQLSGLIWEPLSDVLKDKENIYFAPTGQLHNIAIESVPCYDGEGLMSSRWNLHRLSSTRELALIKEENEIKEAYVYGGLSYDMDAADVIANYHKYSGNTRSVDWETVHIADSLQLRHADWQVLTPLPATKVEAEDIDRSLKDMHIHSTLLTDTLGTEASFKALSGCRPNILHLATHGFYWTESEAKEFDLRSMAMLNNDAQAKYVEDKALTRSGLFLAGAENAFYDVQLPEGVDDGILTAKEISTLDLRGLDLVVLSACETGLGEITGDGVFGLQRGFKKAGANTLMMSLWKVDDDATQMLMSQFYANLAKGESKSTALKDAQEYVRTYENGKYADPGYWAGFILLDAVD